ncbi:MAG: GLUG motif-containing protein [bacterium]
MLRCQFLTLILLFIFTGCGDLEPEIQDTRTITLNMDFQKRSSSRNNPNVSASELSQYNTHLIVAVPSRENLSSSYLSYYYSSFYAALMNPQEKRVSLEIPLNTELKIFAFLFQGNYNLEDLLLYREVGHYGQSGSFYINNQTNNLSIGITLLSTGNTSSSGTNTGSIEGITTIGTTSDSTPDYTFASTIAGTITYGGSCSSTTTSASVGNNTITFNTLSNGTYYNCTIKVTDSSGNESNTLTITAFTVNASLLVPTATQPPLQNPSSAYNSNSNKYAVSTIGHLSWIAQNSSSWDKAYIQTTNIDATSTKYWDDTDANSDGDKYNDADDITSTGNDEGFSPIGNSTSQFTSSYDGNGYSISGLTINRGSTNEVGMFGYTQGAVISKLHLENDNITGSFRVGSLVGYLFNSSIEKCSSSGTVTGDRIVGGLVGITSGLSGGTSSVNNSFSTAIVTAGDSTGIAGGLTGFLLVNTNVTNSYSTGSITANASRGGLVGISQSSTVTDSFYDQTTSGQTDNTMGKPKTTAQMKNIVTFTDNSSSDLTTSWNFTTIWNIDNSAAINNGYPYLR